MTATFTLPFDGELLEDIRFAAELFKQAPAQYLVDAIKADLDYRGIRQEREAQRPDVMDTPPNLNDVEVRGQVRV